MLFNIEYILRHAISKVLIINRYRNFLLIQTDLEYVLLNLE